MMESRKPPFDDERPFGRSFSEIVNIQEIQRLWAENDDLRQTIETHEQNIAELEAKTANLEQENEVLEEMSRTDKITGLPTRQAIVDEWEKRSEEHTSEIK